jgi:antirestriction protein ArdC
MARRQYTEAERAEAEESRRELVEQLHGQLADAISGMTSPEAWISWLRTASQFHRYSFNNQMLIMGQNPDATAVAGYSAWKALGYQVRRGEKAIRVLAPVTRRMEKRDSRTGELVTDAAGNPAIHRVIVGVKPVSVFDAAQVDPAPPQAPMPELLEGAAPPGLWESLAELVRQEGYTLRRGDCSPANGVTDYTAREVTVRPDLDDSQAVKTLAHELGHVLLPPPAEESLLNPVCRGLREIEAESVAYIVTHAHGLDSGEYTFGYVANWGGRTSAASGVTVEELVQQTATRVVGAAGQVLQHTLAGVPDLEVAVADAVSQELAAGRRWEEVQRRPSRAVELEKAVIVPAVAAAAITL